MFGANIDDSVASHRDMRLYNKMSLTRMQNSQLDSAMFLVVNHLMTAFISIHRFMFDLATQGYRRITCRLSYEMIFGRN